MSNEKRKGHVQIDYERLGTLSQRELIDALIDDLHMIEEDYGVKFFADAKLILWGSNEWGDPRHFIRAGGGGRMKRLDSTHYRPACMDYDL